MLDGQQQYQSITHCFIPSRVLSVLASLFSLPLISTPQALRHSLSRYSLWLISSISSRFTSLVIFSTSRTSPSSTSLVRSCSTLRFASFSSFTSNCSSFSSSSAFSRSRFSVRSHIYNFCQKESMALSPSSVWLGSSMISPSLSSLSAASSIQLVSWLKRLKQASNLACRSLSLMSFLELLTTFWQCLMKAASTQCMISRENSSQSLRVSLNSAHSLCLQAIWVLSQAIYSLCSLDVFWNLSRADLLLSSYLLSLQLSLARFLVFFSLYDSSCLAVSYFFIHCSNSLYSPFFYLSQSDTFSSLLLLPSSLQSISCLSSFTFANSYLYFSTSLCSYSACSRASSFSLLSSLISASYSPLLLTSSSKSCSSPSTCLSMAFIC